MAYTSHYPPEQSITYVKATSVFGGGWEADNSTDPALPLTGGWGGNEWLSGNTQTTNQRFHIDLGEAFYIRRIYLENKHESGNLFTEGIKNFTFWGSNSATAFAELTYATDTGWTQLTTNPTQWREHAAADASDPQYATVDNTTAYRYYAFKIADNWGNASYMSFRHVELQTEDGWTPNTAPNAPTNSSPSNAATGVSINPTLQSSAFSDNDAGEVHQGSQWLVATDAGFTDTVWDSGTETVNLVSCAVTSAIGTFGGTLSGSTALDYNTTYYWKVRHQDDSNEWSSYSTATTFTTTSGHFSAMNTYKRIW